MQKGDYLTTILRSNKTVFTFKDILLIWQESNTNAAKVRLNYYVKKNDLYRIRRGIYAKDKSYNKFELATRIFIPAYVSFETVLSKEGLIFQYQKGITVASYLTREIEVDGQIYSYKKMKNVLLVEPLGVINKNEMSIACKERALLDTLYLNANYHFDNLRSLDWDRTLSMLAIYDNKRMTQKVNSLYKNFGGKK